MIIVLMAAYNEVVALSDILARMPGQVDGHGVRVIVLSDGSTDGTGERARSFGVEVIEFGENRGKGAMLKSGLNAIRDDPCSALVFMDADGQHDPAQFEALVAPVLDGSARIVVGSRYLLEAGKGNAPLNRYAVRWIVRATLGSLLATSVTDPFSGYRCLAPDAVQCLELTGDRYESELEMLFCAERSGLRMLEVPIPKLYGPGTSKMGRRHGSTFGRVKIVYRYAVTIIREAIRLRTWPASTAEQIVPR